MARERRESWYRERSWTPLCTALEFLLVSTIFKAWIEGSAYMIPRRFQIPGIALLEKTCQCVPLRVYRPGATMKHDLTYQV